MNSSKPIEHLHRLLVRLEDFQEEYLFFCTDVVEICRKYGKVNQDLESKMKIRKTQMADFFERFVSYGYMKPEPAKGFYKRLQHTIRILLTFWKSQELVVTNFNLNDRGEMVRHVWELFLTHFTDKGLREYKVIVKGQQRILVKR